MTSPWPVTGHGGRRSRALAGGKQQSTVVHHAPLRMSGHRGQRRPTTEERCQRQSVSAAHKHFLSTGNVRLSAAAQGPCPHMLQPHACKIDSCRLTHACTTCSQALRTHAGIISMELHQYRSVSFAIVCTLFSGDLVADEGAQAQHGAARASCCGCTLPCHLPRAQQLAGHDSLAKQPLNPKKWTHVPRDDLISDTSKPTV